MAIEMSQVHPTLAGFPCRHPIWMLQVKVEALYPQELGNISPAAFLERCGELDASFAQQVQTAAKNGEVLRYVASVEQGNVRVGLRSVPRASALGSLQGTDNLVAFHTMSEAPTCPPMSPQLLLTLEAAAVSAPIGSPHFGVVM
jgi:homoserine dehydrogenase